MLVWPSIHGIVHTCGHRYSYISVPLSCGIVRVCAYHHSVCWNMGSAHSSEYISYDSPWHDFGDFARFWTRWNKLNISTGSVFQELVSCAVQAKQSSLSLLFYSVVVLQFCLNWIRCPSMVQVRHQIQRQQYVEMFAAWIQLVVVSMILNGPWPTILVLPYFMVTKIFPLM